MTHPAILWKRLDRPGHEAAWVEPHGTGWQLAGTAVFNEAGQPCSLAYEIECDAAWRTRTARVRGRVAGERIDLEITAPDTARAGTTSAGTPSADRRWRNQGNDCPNVTGCIDIDLNFSPSTNLLPIRRLALEVGAQATVRAAWLRFPSFTLEPLEQVYRRIDATTYRYESAGGKFVATLEVDTAGFPTRYPGFWEIENLAALG